MFALIQVLAIVLAIISHEHEAIAAASIVVQVNKHTDAAKPLYSAHAYLNVSWASHQYPGVPITLPEKEQNMLIDLDAPFMWRYSFPRQESCGACPEALTCDEFPCTDLRTTYSYQSPSCPPPTNHSLYEGHYDCELCPVNIISPVTKSCSQSILTYDQLMFNISDAGRNVLSDMHIIFPIVGSTPPWTFDPFPSNVVGVIALSSSPYAIPAYLQDPVENIIGLCLPSTSSTPGVLFLGNGPYYLPPQSNDIRSLLSYTILLKQPNSFGYFIAVDAVVIKNRTISVPANTTAKISTLTPYTELRTDVYNNLVRRFSRVTRRIPRAKSVAVPFGLCFNTTVNGTNVGVRVPDVDLVLQDGKKWTISTANSIKQVTEEVACLAFVDGGATSEHAIVIGTYQFEDNFLLFDLENSTFGFSSSLLRRQTSCSNFNFTLTH